MVSVPPASAIRTASFDRRVGSLSGPAAHGFRGRALRSLRRPPRRWRWGFCSIRGWLSACRRRVVVLMPPFPPFGGSPSVALVSVAPKVQTTSVKNAEYGRLLARWSAFWAQWCQSWCDVSRVLWRVS